MLRYGSWSMKRKSEPEPRFQAERRKIAADPAATKESIENDPNFAAPFAF